jgi:ADP-ribose pyrophosphatase YjhB (NUDIX family)
MTKKERTTQWLVWARAIQSIAQIGDTYAVNEWQHDRYQRLMRIAAEIVSEHAKLPTDSVLQNFSLQTGYATPKVDVRGAVFRDQKLLLVEEKYGGGWTMPGGWADVGDAPAASAEREVWEESGFLVKTRRLVGVYDANRVAPMVYYHAYKLVFLCEIVGGEARLSNETTSVAFFSEDDIPLDFAGERTQLRHVKDAFGVHRDPTQPVVFD